MSIDSGKLRHRVQVQEPVHTQNPVTGESIVTWNTIWDLWAAVEPLSAREFIQSQSTQSQVVARITIRYVAGFNAAMRIVHNGTNYNIAGLLPDKDSGLEYITVPVSQGVNTGE